MNFADYKIAAERHLETCFNLAEKLTEFEKYKQIHNARQYSIDRHNHILSNLYYLTGYMLECLYNYAICKYENANHPIIGDTKNALDTAPIGRYKICFSRNKKTRLSVNYSLDREAHRLSLSELSFFEREGVVTSGSIPLMDNSTTLSNSDLHTLFLKWSVYERYKINYFDDSNFPLFDFNNVLKYFWEIVDICSQISNSIIREQTLFIKIIRKRPTTI